MEHPDWIFYKSPLAKMTLEEIQALVPGWDDDTFVSGSPYDDEFTKQLLEAGKVQRKELD